MTTAKEFAEFYDMELGTGAPAMIQRIMREMQGEAVGPELAYDLTGKPDQWLTIPGALKAAGCRPKE